MARFTSDQHGVAMVVAIALLFIVGLAGFAGYQVLSSKNPAVKTTVTTQDDATVSETPIKNASDVDAATKELDSTAIDSELDDSSLDADAKAL